MEVIRQTEKKFCTRALMIAIVICLFCMAIEQVAIGKGLILGCLFSILNFILIGVTLPNKLLKSKRKTFFISLGSIYFRYIFLAIPLIVSIKFEEFNLFSTIVGLFTVQMVLIEDHLRSLIKTLYREKFRARLL
jgi:hypothetical protein